MIAIIDYDAGNLTSVERAIRSIGYEVTVTNDPDTILAAERVIFPGVGSAGSAMDSLTRFGLDGVIKKVLSNETPLMGICLGTQIILGHSEEHDTACLGLMEGDVELFEKTMTEPDGTQLKIPHMGWNSIKADTSHPVLKDIKPEDEFYFVHSYYPAPANKEHSLGTTTYGITFTSIMGRNNLIATQFHPEKSGRAGLTILKNFCEWTPC